MSSKRTEQIVTGLALLAFALYLAYLALQWLLGYLAARLPQYAFFVGSIPPTDDYAGDSTEAAGQTVEIPPSGNGGFTGGGGGRSGGAGAGGAV